MARRRYFRSTRRGWYRYNSRRFNRYAKYNYQNYKLDVSSNIHFPGTQIGSLQFGLTNSTVISFADRFFNSTNNAEWAKLFEMYQFYRVRGLRVECVPAPQNANNPTVVHNSPCYLGYIVINAEPANLATSDKSILLNPLGKTSKYWNFFGYQDDWKVCGTNPQFSGGVQVYSAETATEDTGPAWECKVTLYLSFKGAKQ